MSGQSATMLTDNKILGGHLICISTILSGVRTCRRMAAGSSAPTTWTASSLTLS